MPAPRKPEKGESWSPRSDGGGARRFSDFASARTRNLGGILDMQPMGSLSAYEPSWREKMGWGLAGMFDLPPERQRYIAEKAGGIFDFVPGIGEALGADDTARAAEAGDYVSAGINGAATAAGMIPVAGDLGGALLKAMFLGPMAKNADKALLGTAKEMAEAGASIGDDAAEIGVEQGIRAYHGSPHDFDRFSLDKIGTGEGAQAYGHGLYFAENEGVAQSYRDTLSRRNVTGTFDGMPLNDTRDWWKAVDKANAEDWRVGKLLDQYGRVGGDKEWFVRQARDEYRDQPAMLQALDSFNARMDATHRQGKMYEVNIKANPDDFLDWDKPLSEQPPLVQDLARNSDLSGVPSRTRRMIEAWRGEYTPPEGMVVPEPTGNDLHSALTDYGTDIGRNTRLTERLREAGIPGIKYLDRGSRGNGDGSRNYVVFDDSLIEIVKKYGIAAALGAGLITEAMARQMQEQGIAPDDRT